MTVISRRGLVFGLLALSSTGYARPHHKLVPSVAPTSQAQCTYPDGTHSHRPDIHCYTPSEFDRAYGIDKLHAMGLTGRGQVIVVVDSYGDPTAQADLDHFSDTFGLPHTTVKFVYPNGTYLNPLQTDDQVGWAQETALDLEWAHAVAPDATIVSVITNSSETTGMTGMADIFKGIQMAIDAYPGAVISMSFGTAEGTFSADEIKTYVKGQFHDVFASAGKKGVTLLASSGDSGSTDMNLDDSSYIAAPTAGYPASDSYVTAIGGTALELDWTWDPEGTADDFWKCKLAGTVPCPKEFLRAKDTPGSRIETVWKEDFAVAAGGGGVSAIFELPHYQRDVHEKALKIMKGKRGLPDVSLNAAINGGVDVYTSFVSPDHGAEKAMWQSYGGTSCSSPETAGLIALAAQRVADKSGRNAGIGYLNPILYRLPNDDFHDIKAHKFGDQEQVEIASNMLYFNADVLKADGPTTVPPVAVPGFETMHRYDLATGRGTPKAYDFVLDIAEARLDQLGL